jgi:penicillin-binding protein 1A
MLKNSSLFNPLRRPERVEKRRNVVLNQMKRNGFVTEVELDSLKQIPLEIDYTPDSHREGLATYFRAYLQQFMRKWTKDNPKPDGTNYDIFRDGLRIYTTLDSRLQQIGETAVDVHMANLQEEFFLQNTPTENPTAPFLDLREGEITTKHADLSAGEKCALLEKMKMRFGLRFKNQLKWKFLVGKAIEIHS